MFHVEVTLLEGEWAGHGRSPVIGGFTRRDLWYQITISIMIHIEVFNHPILIANSN